MDPVIFTGRVPVDELKHDKPREYEEFVEGRRSRACGRTDQGTGETVDRKGGEDRRVHGAGHRDDLIVLIVYTMVFGYL